MNPLTHSRIHRHGAQSVIKDVSYNIDLEVRNYPDLSLDPDWKEAYVCPAWPAPSFTQNYKKKFREQPYHLDTYLKTNFDSVHTRQEMKERTDWTAQDTEGRPFRPCKKRGFRLLIF